MSSSVITEYIDFISYKDNLLKKDKMSVLNSSYRQPADNTAYDTLENDLKLWARNNTYFIKSYELSSLKNGEATLNILPWPRNDTATNDFVLCNLRTYMSRFFEKCDNYGKKVDFEVFLNFYDDD